MLLLKYVTCYEYTYSRDYRFNVHIMIGRDLLGDITAITFIK